MDFILSQLHSLSFTEKIIAYLFIGSSLIQLFYYFFFYARTFSFGKTGKSASNEQPGLSVIICAKNEGNNLKGFLEKVLTQDYPNYQVVVVDDASQDHTNAVLNEYKKKYSHLYVTHLEENRQFPHGKKLALTVGVKAAKHERMVFTDADCRPDSNKWLQSIAEATSSGKDIILGYGAYLKRRGLLNRIIRFDTLFIGIQYLTFAKAGLPYMGVGRNMSYTKKTYDSVRGFSSHYHILSGDDDLFINQTARKKNTTTVTVPDSIVRSVPKTTFSSYIYQKRRHLTTGKHYRFVHKLMLGTEILSRMLFYISFALALSLNVLPTFVFGLFALRFLWQHAIVLKAGQVFKEKDLPVFTLFFDIFIPLLNIWASLSKYLIKNKIKHKW